MGAKRSGENTDADVTGSGRAIVEVFERAEICPVVVFITGAGRAAYGAETGAHDDLVVAVALAVWWAWLMS